jgi:hypothetical protein
MQNRSEGQHISTVISDLCIKLGHYPPRDEEDKNSEIARRNFMILGKALEFALIQMFALDNPDQYIDIGELEKEGRFGTPDLLDINEDRITEIKLTWISMKHDIHSQKFWRYWVQLKSYCYMHGTPLGRLIVAYANIDWKLGGPQYREWDVEFTRQELLENWAMISTHGNRMLREGIVK